MKLTVLTRPECSLCETLAEALQAHVAGRATIELHDVDIREDWRQRYGLKIPVVLDDSGLMLMWGQFDPDKLPLALRTP